MRGHLTTLDRRDFLKNGLTAGAVALTAGTVTHAAAPKSKQISSTGRIPERPFGKTGHSLPVLGHGGSAMVNSWASAYNVTLPDEAARVEMVRHAYDMGVRYFDTARVYSESESIMGRALKDVRDNVYLVTKVATPVVDQVRRSVETSLQNLQTDYVDCMQIHSPVIERVGPDAAMKVYEELAKLREEGMIRFIGLTTHVAFESVYKMIDTGLFDQVLLARGYFRKGMDMMLSNANIEWRERCMARAHDLNMGIVIMKVMGLNVLGRGGAAVVADYDAKKREQLPGAAIRWALSDPRVSVLNIGISVPEDIDRNVAICKADLTLTSEDQLLLADYAEKAYNSDFIKALRVV